MSLRLDPVSAAAAGRFAEPLAKLHAACFPEEPWPPKAVAEIMGIAGFFGWMAWSREVPAGLALAQALGEECEILTLGVVPERRRAGVGSALLAAITAAARRRGAQRLFLEVAADNSGARALYAARGFVQIGRRVNYYRRAGGLADALVLRLLLST